MSLVSIFGTAILPLVVISGLGFLLGRMKDLDVEPLNSVTIYVLAPALVFHSLTTTTLGQEIIFKVMVGVVIFIVAMATIGEVVGRLIGETEPLLSALVLVCAFPNTGNFGIPLSEFAFGQIGRSSAVLFLATQSVVTFTVGVYIASRSGGTRGISGVKRVFKVPLVYAVVAAGAVRWLGLVPPIDSTPMTTLELVGNSAIPVMLLILGIQLSGTDYEAAIGYVGVASVLKLVVAPVVGVGVVLGLGINDPTVARVFILECAAPAAITPVILLIEFGGPVELDDLSAPEFGSTAVLVTTLISIPLLTLLIAVLEAGIIV